jgi:hypothetical protein
MCGAETPAFRHGEDAPLLLFQHLQDGRPVRGLACAAAALQSQSTASPPGCPNGFIGPLDSVHGRYAARAPWLALRPTGERLACSAWGLRCLPTVPQGANLNTPRERSPLRRYLLLAASGQVQACAHRERCWQAPGVSRRVPDTVAIFASQAVSTPSLRRRRAYSMYSIALLARLALFPVSSADTRRRTSCQASGVLVLASRIW